MAFTYNWNYRYSAIQISQAEGQPIGVTGVCPPEQISNDLLLQLNAGKKHRSRSPDANRSRQPVISWSD
ncbi:MAG: hypothetical protein IH598_07150 [Bacteroidales bacterium]|nr:hypothetical protein [Bacteroidales bacterium]